MSKRSGKDDALLFGKCLGPEFGFKDEGVVLGQDFFGCFVMFMDLLESSCTEFTEIHCFGIDVSSLDCGELEKVSDSNDLDSSKGFVKFVTDGSKDVINDVEDACW